VEFIFHGVFKLKVKNRWRYCLSYSCIDKCGELFDGGHISLDKRWMMPCATPAVRSEWQRTKYKVKTGHYCFPDPNGGEDYTVYQELINEVDSVLLEEYVLGIRN
jgi:hypothetical protein